jgi:hypothetical protein
VLRLNSLLLTVPPAISSANNERFQDDLQSANLVAARMLKRLGMTAQALRTTRGSFEWTGSPNWPLTTIFRKLGRLAACRLPRAKSGHGRSPMGGWC